MPIEGGYWPGVRPDAPAVLLLHGVNSSRASLTRHAVWLNGLGYAVLAIVFAAMVARAVPRSFGLYEARDAAGGAGAFCARTIRCGRSV